MTHPDITHRDQMVRAVTAYGADGQPRAAITLDQISDVLDRDDGSFVWVGLYEPDETLLLKMQEEFGLHPLAVEDALKAHQRPKIEPYGDSLFLVLHTAQVVKGHIEFGETHAFIGPRYLLTVRHGASLPFSPARERCEKNPLQLQLGPSYALYSVLDSVVDNYFPIVEEFRAELDELEKEIFAEEYRRETVRRLYELKGDLTQLRLAAVAGFLKFLPFRPQQTVEWVLLLLPLHLALARRFAPRADRAPGLRPARAPADDGP